MTVELEVSNRYERTVIAWYSNPDEEEDAVAQCGIAFTLLFPKSDFQMVYIPPLHRSPNNPVSQRGLVAMEACKSRTLPNYIRKSYVFIHNSDGTKTKYFDEHGGHRRDYMMQFEFRKRMRENHPIISALGRRESLK